jgi:hypothetical protein
MIDIRQPGHATLGRLLANGRVPVTTTGRWKERPGV